MPKVAKRLKNLLFLQQTLVAKYYLFWISDKFPSGVGGGGGGGGGVGGYPNSNLILRQRQSFKRQKSMLGIIF